MDIVLILIIILLLGVIALDSINTIKITDDIPDNPTVKNCWMKLQNEGMKYVKIKKGKIYLKIKY